MKIRLKYANSFKFFFWAWDCKLGYTSIYYDGWQNSINLGFICLCWITPPLEGD